MKTKKNSNKRIWLILLITSSLLYFGWRIFYTIPINYGLTSLLFGVILLIAELSGAFDLFIHFWNTSKLLIPIKPTLPTNTIFPEVDVFIATYDEPISIIHKTIIGCLNMTYPDSNKVHLYVLDDGRRTELKELCKQLKIGYLSRETNEHAKAGNINHALKQTHSPYIVTFDADMIPMENFLMESIPYFIENQRQREQEKQGTQTTNTKPLGFLQIPQTFYNPDAFQYRLFAERQTPNEQNYFHREVQLGKNASNSVIYSGSNTILSRACLNEIGGFVTGIITEDIATGIKIQSQGYQCFALDTVQASGLSPYDLNGLIKQRQRWARGCIQTFRRENPLTLKGLTVAQRLNYFDALLYWYSSLKRFVYILAPILFAVFNIIVVEAPLNQVVLFWLPFYLISSYAFKFFSQKARTVKWTNIYETILMPSLLLAVLAESLGLKKRTFEVTPKTRNLDKEKSTQLRLAIPHTSLLVLSLIGIYRCLIALTTPFWYQYVVILFWLCLNSYTLTMALFFIWGRPAFRDCERFYLKGMAFLNRNDELLSFDLHNLSETGVALTSTEAFYFSTETDYPLRIEVQKELFEVSARFLRTNSRQKTEPYQYIFTFTTTKAADYDALIRTLYNRTPDFPTQTISQSPWTDMWQNLAYRLKPSNTFSRQTPRVSVNQIITEGLRAKEFNFQYLVVQGNHHPDELKTPFNDQFLTFKYIKPLKSKRALYQLQEVLTPDLIRQLEKAMTELKI